MDEYTMTEEAYKNGYEAGKAAALNELTAEIHANAKAHGWWDEPRSFGEIAMLCVCEIAEAVEEYRNGRPMIYYPCNAGRLCVEDRSEEAVSCGSRIEDPDEPEAPCLARSKKPEGIAVEMADCIIRILDWYGQMGVDIGEIIRIKHEYNKTRPYRHGGKVI